MKRMEKTSILICGGGLGGSACAIHLAQLGYPVILVDKACFPRKKLCGEFLGPDAMPILDSLGVLKSVLSVSNGPVQNIYLYNAAGKRLHIRTNWIRKDYPYALAQPRMVLDNLLLNKAKTLGVQVIEDQSIIACEQVDDLFFLTLNSSPEKLSSSCIVDASGRNSRLSALSRRGEVSLRDSPKKHHYIEKHVGIQCHLRINTETNDLSMFFFKGGYGGIQPISNEIANLCLWLTPELAQKIPLGLPALLEASISQNPAARPFLTRLETIEPFETAAGLHQLHLLEKSKKIISVGDAQLTVEPFSGFGMSHALRTGVLAAECIHHAFNQGYSYQESLAFYTTRYQQVFGKHLVSLRLGRHFLSSPILQKCLWPILPPFLPFLTALYR
jgi:flavin-dependent dehydrogenase